MQLRFLVGMCLRGLASASWNSSAIVSSSISTPTGTLVVTNSEQCACTALLQTFGDSVILPGQANYTYQTVDYFWDIRADLSPACVFVPQTAGAVAAALKIFNSCNAQFAVRGGGHMNVRLRGVEQHNRRGYDMLTIHCF
jgi:hypothetical protein